MDKELKKIIKEKNELYLEITNLVAKDVGTQKSKQKAILVIFQEVCKDKRKLEEAKRVKNMIKGFEKIFKSMEK